MRADAVGERMFLRNEETSAEKGGDGDEYYNNDFFLYFSGRKSCRNRFQFVLN